ncbi:oxidative stress defense protein [Shewanella sp. YIC-542]|uniref:oxidative stress defense protein n=1 Tax=Shewanella mytili TaxID=3377111 RepID=UPI00398E5FE7
MNKKLILPAALALLLPSLTVAGAASAQERPLLETVGVSQIDAEPDLAQVTVEVVITADAATEAKQQVDKAVTAFIGRLQQAGVDKDDINSANLNLQPRYVYPKDSEPQLSGYRASRTVTLQVALGQLNPLLDNALEEGINSVRQISLKSSREAELRLQARTDAIKDARQKAKALAAGFETELDGIWSIRYFDSSPMPAVNVSRKLMMASADDQSYQYGKVTFSDRVEVSYKLAD